MRLLLTTLGIALLGVLAGTAYAAARASTRRPPVVEKTPAVENPGL